MAIDSLVNYRRIARKRPGRRADDHAATSRPCNTQHIEPDIRARSSVVLAKHVFWFVFGQGSWSKNVSRFGSAETHSAPNRGNMWSVPFWCFWWLRYTAQFGIYDAKELRKKRIYSRDTRYTARFGIYDAKELRKKRISSMTQTHLWRKRAQKETYLLSGSELSDQPVRTRPIQSRMK